MSRSTPVTPMSHRLTAAPAGLVSLLKLPRSGRSPYATAAATLVVFGLMLFPSSALALVAPICDGFPRSVEVGKTERMLGSCSDMDGDALVITIVQQPTLGVAGVDDQGTSFPSVNYTATAAGPDSFTFQASDGFFQSSEAVVTTNNYGGTTPGTQPPSTTPPPGSSGRPGKCSKLRGKKRARCIKKRCGKLKGKKKRTCLKKVTRKR